MADGDEGMLQLLDMDSGDDGRDCDSEVSDDATPPDDDLDVEDMPGEPVTSMNAWQKLQHIEHIDGLIGFSRIYFNELMEAPD